MPEQVIDICILTAGGNWGLLKKCLASIEKDLHEHKEIKAQVYLVDNGSDTWKENLDILNNPIITRRKRLSRNEGYPQGANSVINMGTSELVFFITDDVTIMPGTLSTLINTMQDKSIGLCGLKLLFPLDGSSPSGPAGKVQHVGHCVTIRGDINHQFIGWSSDNPRCCKSGEVFSVTGATFMVRRKIFQQVRGFDVSYGIGTYEDTDLALKIRQAGYRIYLEAAAIGEHYVGATARSFNTSFPLEKNKAIFFNKWMPKGLIVWDEYLRA